MQIRGAGASDTGVTPPDSIVTDETTSSTETSPDGLVSPLTPTIHKVPGESAKNSAPLGNSSFKRHKFSLKVSLYHNGVKYDLTPNILQVKTHMALGEPSGKFTILLNFKKRWDLLVFAMDYIEIAFARYTNDPPIMMRGFVGNVRRSRVADSSGKVQRVITINGENFGKIWNNYYIEYLVQEIGQQYTGGDIIGTPDALQMNMLLENYGIAQGDPDTGNISLPDLMLGLRDKMLNPYIQVLQQINPQIPLLKSAIAMQSSYKITNGPIIQSVMNQTVYDVINQYGNRPFCEYYIDDFTSGPTIFFRDAPFKSENGKLNFSGSNPQSNKALAPYFDHPMIDDTDVIEEDVGTSDNESYSYFFTYPANAMYAQTDPRASILGMQIMTAEQESDTSIISNPHVDLENMYRFGFKSLMIPSNAIPVIPDSDIPVDLMLQAQTMNEWLVRSFVWSHKMLNGTMRVKGNEHLRIGRYVTQKSTSEEYYIESVDHEITIAQPGSLGNDSSYRFDSTIGLTRGRHL